jgi:hypothetical protein
MTVIINDTCNNPHFKTNTHTHAQGTAIKMACLGNSKSDRLHEFERDASRREEHTQVCIQKD